MKKKFLVGLLALAMPLTACDFSFDSLKFWEKNEENSQENQENSDENQNQDHNQDEQEHHDDDGQIPRKTNLVIQDYVASILGKETFTQEQENYFVSRAIDVDGANVDIAKIEKYVDEFPALLEKSNPVLAVGDYLVSVQKEEGLDDVANFAVALGRSLLYIMKSEEPYNVPSFAALIDVVENEASNIAKNAYELANKVIDIYSLATQATFLNSCTGLVNSETGRFVTANLKEILAQSTKILDKFVEVKQNAVYFVNLAKNALKAISDASKLTETDDFSKMMFKVIDRVYNIDLGGAVGSVFDFIGDLSSGIKTLDNSYYAQIDALSNPIEADLYAVIGLIEHLVKDEQIDVAKAMENVEDFVEFAKEIYGYIKDEIGDVPAFVTTIINSANTKLTLVKATKLIVNLLNVRLVSINALSLTKICAYLFFSPTSAMITPVRVAYVFEDVPEDIRNLVDTVDMEYELNKSGYYSATYYGELVVDAKGNATIPYSFFSAQRIYADIDNNIIENIYTFGYNERTVPNMDEFAGYVFAIIDELASSEIPAQFARDLLDIVPSAYALFNEIKDNFAIDEETLNIIDTIVGLVSEKQELVEKTITDLFVFVRNLASAFVKVGDKDPDLDLTSFVLDAIVNGLDLNLLKVSEERLAGLVDLAEDVYEILDYVELADSISSLISYLAGGVTIENAEQFAQAIYTIVITMFVPVEK